MDVNKKIELQAIELAKVYLEQRDKLCDLEKSIILKTLQMVNVNLEKEND